MAAVVIPALMQGCSSDNPLCCSQSEFTPGATVTVSGSAQAVVAVQAVGDFSAIAATAVSDITTACANIASDLDGIGGDTAEARATIDANTDKRARMTQYCKLAVDTLTSAIAGQSLTIKSTPAVCEASFSAKASCQAKCDVSGKCDIKATPPKCTGGTLSVSCTGGCNVSASKPSITCEGQCGASCTGACTVTTGSVECAGKCNGTCTASAGGSGPQADGTCKGGCSGTCEVTAPSATCSGSCKGSCTGSCQASGGIQAKCDQVDCQGDYTPISCTGGTLEGGCTVDAKCDANCEASVQAKASCTPPSLTITFSGNVAAVRATLEANLPTILGITGRINAMGKLTGTITGNATVIADIKAACIPVVIGAAADGAQDIVAAGSATLSFANLVTAS